MTIKSTDELEFPAEMWPQFRLTAAIKITQTTLFPDSQLCPFVILPYFIFQHVHVVNKTKLKIVCERN